MVFQMNKIKEKGKLLIQDLTVSNCWFHMHGKQLIAVLRFLVYGTNLGNPILSSGPQVKKKKNDLLIYRSSCIIVHTVAKETVCQKEWPWMLQRIPIFLSCALGLPQIRRTWLVLYAFPFQRSKVKFQCWGAFRMSELPSVLRYTLYKVLHISRKLDLLPLRGSVKHLIYCHSFYFTNAL